MDWFLNDRELCHERDNYHVNIISKFMAQHVTELVEVIHFFSI